jgi:hypothetical protein
MVPSHCLPLGSAQATTKWTFSTQSLYTNDVGSTCATITRFHYSRVTELSNNAHDDSSHPLDGPNDSSQPHGQIFLKIYYCKGYFGYVMIGKIKFSIFSKCCISCCSL